MIYILVKKLCKTPADFGQISAGGLKIGRGLEIGRGLGTRSITVSVRKLSIGKIVIKV